MREVVGLATLDVSLQEVDGSFFQILQQDDVVFTYCIIDLALKCVVSLEVTRTHPERFFVHLVWHDSDELDWQLFVFLLGETVPALLRRQKRVR